MDDALWTWVITINLFCQDVKPLMLNVGSPVAWGARLVRILTSWRCSAASWRMTVLSDMMSQERVWLRITRRCLSLTTLWCLETGGQCGGRAVVRCDNNTQEYYAMPPTLKKKQVSKTRGRDLENSYRTCCQCTMYIVHTCSPFQTCFFKDLYI